MKSDNILPLVFMVWAIIQCMIVTFVNPAAFSIENIAEFSLMGIMGAWVVGYRNAKDEYDKKREADFYSAIGQIGEME